jgi:hypothetical protein
MAELRANLTENAISPEAADRRLAAMRSAFPDEFLLDQLDLYPGLTIRSLQQLSEDYDSPPTSVEQLLQWLSKAGVPRFTQEVTTRHLA